MYVDGVCRNTVPNRVSFRSVNLLSRPTILPCGRSEWLEALLIFCRRISGMNKRDKRKRQVFYSFHYKNDVMRAAQIRNIGAIEGNMPARNFVRTCKFPARPILCEPPPTQSRHHVRCKWTTAQWSNDRISKY